MTKKSDYLSALESAIKIRHKCQPAHRQTMFVRAKTKEQEIVWEGLVEEFELSGHQRARNCYAWRHIEAGGKSKIIAVLGNRLIDSPQKAVEAAIFTDTQPPVRKFSDEIESLKKQLQECKDLLRKMGIESEDLSAAIEESRTVSEGLRRIPV
ncbi:MAG: hypothetical protein ACREE6_13090 [Limisphaerales bacterium]